METPFYVKASQLKNYVGRTVTVESSQLIYVVKGVVQEIEQTETSVGVMFASFDESFKTESVRQIPWAIHGQFFYTKPSSMWVICDTPELELELELEFKLELKVGDRVRICNPDDDNDAHLGTVVTVDNRSNYAYTVEHDSVDNFYTYHKRDELELVDNKKVKLENETIVRFVRDFIEEFYGDMTGGEKVKRAFMLVKYTELLKKGK